MPQGDVATAKVHRDWLQRISNLTGKSLTRLATETGLAVSTLTRPVKEGDTGTSTLHAKTIKKLSEHTGVAPPGAEDGMLNGPRRPLRGFQEDAEPFAPQNDDELTQAVRALLAAHPKAAPWLIKTRALELAGYLPGDVAVVLPEAAPGIGELVCARVNLDQRHAGDVVLRAYERAGAADVLVACSMDPFTRQPIAVDDRVSILGVIGPMVRARRHAA